MANLLKGIEAVGGKLYLTNQCLIFESHKFNMQSNITEINLSDIRGTKICWFKLLGFIALYNWKIINN